MESSVEHQLDFSGKHSAMQQLLGICIFPPLSIIARYSFTPLSELGHHGENENAQASIR